MEFKSKEDLEAPIEKVFDLMADFDRHERSALRRGIEITRKDPNGAPGVGTTWEAQFKFRGKKRKADIRVVEFERPTQITVEAQIQGLGSRVEFSLVALSQSRTRLAMVAELKPSTLSARLLVQSFKLARGNISKRIDARMANVARDMEDRVSGMA